MLYRKMLFTFNDHEYHSFKKLLDVEVKEITCRQVFKYLRFYIVLTATCFLWVVLVHDTRSNDSRCNDARFMHKLCKHGYFI